MSRFDLYRGRGISDYLLDVQSEYVDFLDSRIVIPVIAAPKMSLVNPRVHLKVSIENEPHYIVTNMMASTPRYGLGKSVGSLAHLSTDITASIDFLLQGF